MHIIFSTNESLTLMHPMSTTSRTPRATEGRRPLAPPGLIPRTLLSAALRLRRRPALPTYSPAAYTHARSWSACLFFRMKNDVCTMHNCTMNLLGKVPSFVQGKKKEKCPVGFSILGQTAAGKSTYGCRFLVLVLRIREPGKNTISRRCACELFSIREFLETAQPTN